MKRELTRNYIILSIVVILTVLLVFYARSWYNTSKIYYSQNSVVKDVASEINYEEIFNYTLESPKFILYVSSGSNNDIKDFEKNFKKLIIKLDLSGNILYLNSDNTTEALNYNLSHNFGENDKVKKQISENPVTAIYVFENGKIISVLNNANNFSMKQIESFIKKSGFDD